MKKQLLILIFLLSGLPVLGMNYDSEDYRTVFLKSFHQPHIQAAISEILEKDKLEMLEKEKQVFGFNIFKTIHQNIYQYFKPNQTEEARRHILEWIMQKLPFMPGKYTEEESQMIQYYREDSLEFITMVLEKPEHAVKLFSTIYIAYLRLNLEQLCKVLFAYFDRELMKNVHYRSILITMIRMLGSYLDHLSLFVNLEGQSERWRIITDSAVEYIKNYPESDTSDKNRDLFTIHYQNTETMCANLGKVLQTIEQRRSSEEQSLEPDSSDNIPEEIISESVTSLPNNHSQNNPLPQQESIDSDQSISPKNSQPVMPQKQSSATEVSQAILTPEPISTPPTMWETIVNGVNRFFEWLLQMNG